MKTMKYSGKLCAIVFFGLLFSSCTEMTQQMQQMGQSFTSGLTSATWAMQQEIGPKEAGSKVTADTAMFLIDLGWQVSEHEMWQWCLNSSPINHQEYSWLLSLENGGSKYAFGFSLFKFENCPQQQGTIRTLLNRGQVNVWEILPGGNSQMLRLGDFIDGSINAQFTRGDGRILIALQGKELIDYLFYARPQQATLQLRIPGEPDSTTIVPLIYEQP